MQELELLDRKILFELDKNSRATYSDIAKKARTKKETVKYHIDNLIKNKIIGGFYTVIDYSKLGFMVFRIYLTLENISTEKREEFLNYLLSNKNIWILYRTTGEWHFTFSIWTRDQWEYERFWYTLIEKFGIYLSNHHLALVTKYTEFSRNYLISEKQEKQEYTILQKTEKLALDKIDFQILQILSINARTPLVEMAKQIRTSVVTCRAHLKKLIKNKVILGFRTMFDYESLGYQYYKVDLWFKDMKNYSQFVSKVLSHPNVIYTERTLATSHFEFDLEVKSFEEFIKIMDEFEDSFPDQIKNYIYYSLVKNYKISFLPQL